MVAGVIHVGSMPRRSRVNHTQRRLHGAPPRSLRLERKDDKPFPDARKRWKQGTNRDLLELRYDAARARLTSVVDEIVAVPTSPTAGTHLHQPRPRRIGRTGECDRMRKRSDRVWNQFVSWQTTRSLIFRGTNISADPNRR